MAAIHVRGDPCGAVQRTAPQGSPRMGKRRDGNRFWWGNVREETTRKIWEQMEG